MSPWTAMPLVGDALEGAPEERFHRVFDAKINTPSQVRAGIWEATQSMSIFDELGHEERFDPGDSFFLEKGFNGIWKQHGTIKIFHMTVDPD